MWSHLSLGPLLPREGWGKARELWLITQPSGVSYSRLSTLWFCIPILRLFSHHFPNLHLCLIYLDWSFPYCFHAACSFSFVLLLILFYLSGMSLHLLTLFPKSFANLPRSPFGLFQPHHSTPGIFFNSLTCCCIGALDCSCFCWVASFIFFLNHDEMYI